MHSLEDDSYHVLHLLPLGQEVPLKERIVNVLLREHLDLAGQFLKPV